MKRSAKSLFEPPKISKNLKTVVMKTVKTFVLLVLILLSQMTFAQCWKAIATGSFHSVAIKAMEPYGLGAEITKANWATALP
jgi:fumarate reductase subunit D